MKYNFIFLFFLIFIDVSFSQNKADSIIKAYDKAKTEKEKLLSLEALANDMYSEKVNLWWETSLDVLKHLRTKKEDSIADRIEIWIANGLNNNGDYSNSLKMSTKVIESFRQRKDSLGIYSAHAIIADAFSYSKNYEASILYLKKSIPYIPFQYGTRGLCSVYNSISDTYALASIPDSGLVYAQKAINLANDLEDNELLCITHMTTAENYLANEDYDLAMPFLRKAKVYSRLHNKEFPLNYLYNDFAQLFLGIKQFDSVKYYADKSIKEPNPIAWKDQLLRSYEYLYKSYEQTNQPDSTYKYFRLATTLKDSLFDMEKIKSMESIRFQEELIQQENELALAKAEQQRQRSIQFVLLAIGIIIFIIVFLLLSRSIITSTRLIKFLSIIALLMVFEFINLILNSFLGEITKNSPILLLLALVIIAASLAPLHRKIEHWTTSKLIEKNKKIRLAAAKKTIEQLESNTEL